MNIAVDIDDTLLDFVRNYILFCNEKYNINMQREDFKTYSFDSEKINEFYKTELFRKLSPFPNAAKVIDTLGKKNNLVIITSRPDELYSETIKQIVWNFPAAFSDVFFSINHYTKAENSGKTKAEICKEKEINLIIEDSLEYAKQCVEKGIDAILLDAPWNQNGIVEGVTRVDDWKKIGGILL